MKKIVLITVFTLIATVCLGLVSCSNNLTNDSQSDTTSQDPITTDAPPSTDNTLSNKVENSMDYKLVEQSGQHYIVFDNISDYDYEDEESSQIDSGLEFGSLAEFKNTVTSGKLTDRQKRVIATSFQKNEQGMILICDFNKLLEPQMPNDCKVEWVYWEGEGYSFYISTSYEVFGFVHNYTQDQYNYLYNRNFEGLFDRPNIHVTEIINTDDGKTVTMYRTFAGDLMRIRYAYENGQKTIIVDESYWLEMSDETLPTSNTVPISITMYCTEPGAYYAVDLFGFTEKPSESWLYEFGMKPYVDLDVEKNN